MLQSMGSQSVSPPLEYPQHLDQPQEGQQELGPRVSIPSKLPDCLQLQGRLPGKLWESRLSQGTSLASLFTGWSLVLVSPSKLLKAGEGNGTPLQYCCLENPMDGGAWWAADHGVPKSRTRLSDFTFTFHFHPGWARQHHSQRDPPFVPSKRLW